MLSAITAQKFVPRWVRWPVTQCYEVEPTLLPEDDGSRSSGACSHAGEPMGTDGLGKHRNVWSADVDWSSRVPSWLTRMMSLSSSRMAEESRADEWQRWAFESVDFKAWDDGM